MAYPVNHTWNMSVMAYLTDWIFEGQLIEAGIICILPLMALFIPHRCPKCFESVTLIQPQDMSGCGFMICATSTVLIWLVTVSGVRS